MLTFFVCHFLTKSRKFFRGEPVKNNTLFPRLRQWRLSHTLQITFLKEGLLYYILLLTLYSGNQVIEQCKRALCWKADGGEHLKCSAVQFVFISRTGGTGQSPNRRAGQRGPRRMFRRGGVPGHFAASSKHFAFYMSHHLWRSTEFLSTDTSPIIAWPFQ